MKKLAFVLFAILLLSCFVLPVAAAETPFVSIDAEMSEDQVAVLETMEKQIEDTYGFEAAFFLDNTMQGGDTFISYVKSFMYQHTETTNCMAFGVSSTSYYVESMGKASRYVTNDDADALYEAIEDADRNGDSYAAAVQFYDALIDLLEKKAESDLIPKTISATRAPRLVDQADILTDEEEATLLAKLDKISEELQFDIVIVTTKSTGRRTPEEFADDYYDYNGFGFGENHDGCACMFSTEFRDCHISTTGEGETAINGDYCIGYLLNTDEFSKAMVDHEYYKAFQRFPDFVKMCVDESRENKPFSNRHRINDAKNKKIGVAVSLVIGLIISAIVTRVVKSGYTDAVHKNSGAGNYLVENSLVLYESQDQFLYTTVDRTKRSNDSDSGSSGSSGGSYVSGHHTGSSGTSHGGGGRRF